MASEWRFNRDYNDLEQVRPFLPAFRARLAELEAAGEYRYNDSFKGRVPGIEGAGEATAIYLLQQLDHQLELDEKVRELEAAGYERMTEVSGPVKCSHIVLYPTRRMGGEWAEYRDARLTPLPYGGMAVLPKGRRTRGYFVNDRAVLALRVKG